MRHAILFLLISLNAIPILISCETPSSSGRRPASYETRDPGSRLIGDLSEDIRCTVASEPSPDAAALADTPAPGTPGFEDSAAGASGRFHSGAANPGTRTGISSPAIAQTAGKAEMLALARAYPQRIDEVRFRKQDWAVRIGDTWYYWAHGRLLPEQLRQRWEEYASYRFYNYSLGLPPLPELDEETKQRLAERLESAVENPPRRSEAFLAELYRARTRAQTEARIVGVEVMGFEVRVHEQIAEPLGQVDRELRILAEADPGARRFLEGLRGMAGYNWREIAGTLSRSYHSYGIAVDLAPKSFGGRHTYWRWALPQTDEWYAIPYSRRWMVPMQIVEVFERQGFIWGGKWLFFDTMHFEYRPEILILAESVADRKDP